MSSNPDTDTTTTNNGNNKRKHFQDQPPPNPAVFLTGLNKMEIEEFTLPPLGPHDVRVRMKAVGICASDVHYLRHGRIADFVVKEKMVIGHESAGEVVGVGSAAVTQLKVSIFISSRPTSLSIYIYIHGPSPLPLLPKPKTSPLSNTDHPFPLPFPIFPPLNK